MTTHTAPTFAEFAAMLTAEQQKLMAGMDAAMASKDHDTYDELRAKWLELGASFDVLWHHKEAARKEFDAARNANVATLADFSDWVRQTQANALQAMNTATTEGFTAHLEAFMNASAARNAVLQFNAARRNAQIDQIDQINQIDQTPTPTDDDQTGAAA